MKPPPLRDDCFAMPPGVDWTPVDVALDRLRAGLHPVVAVEGAVPLTAAAGRILAKDVHAARANPPFANSAVDGYGFAHASLPEGAEVVELPLVEGRAAAGVAFAGAVPAGMAIRVLTGARLPEGVDTVVLEEDCSVEAGRIAFRRGTRKGANTRRAGEDVEAGDVIVARGTRLRGPEFALLAATGIDAVEVLRPLRVGVLSTGEELKPQAGDARIFDANRPMLLATLADWGYRPVDLGQVGDDRAELRARLDAAVETCDAILTSGGASAGDEDHVSAVLAEGRLETWRIAVKPGRPLALALWKGVPVFGLPGNPVAALVCTLVFARPALSLLAGEGWREPQRFTVPAAFSKSKKSGRREYLRARIRGGRAEVFRSEGSGRISGLAWAEGLVELPDAAAEIAPGDPVTYLPFSGF